MNKDQLLSLGRQLLTIFGTAAGTWLVSKGYLSNDQWQAVIGFVTVTLVPIVASNYASWQAHSTAGKAASADADPAFKKVELAPTPANAQIAAKLSDKVTA